tara:strand:+ start:719 stop:1693 length:975 start_codon:yes stop_codon:yes gene_type:complete
MKKVILINMLVIFLIIITGEVLLRVFGNITIHGISKGIINYKDKPVFNYPNISNKKAFGKIIYTDSNGFRISNINQKKRNKKNIYFVGGSVTFGKGVEQENTFTGILNSQIREYNIINAGVVGSNLENNIKIIKKKIEKKNLENIFINFSLDDLVSIDDMIAFEKKKSNKKFSFYEKIKKNSFIIYINNFIRTKSIIYITLKGYFFKTDEVYYQQAINLYKSENNLKFLEKLIEDISELENNSKIVFIMIPYNYQIRKGNCKQDDLAEKEIVKAMANKNIKLIRLKKNFCEDKNPDKIFFSFDPAHLSNYGHKLVAKILMMRLN